MTFMGIPERWLIDPHWRCANGHVSTRYLKSEEKGMALCLACQEPVRLVQREEDLIECTTPIAPAT